MNRVAEISRITSLGVFRNFDWPEDLPEFQRYNVIYGWNGSGKTLLSRIFAGLQKGQPPTCEDVVVKLSSGEELRCNAFANASVKLQVRVFNHDFVGETVYKAGGPIQPIYVFGEKAKETQQELEAVVKRIEETAAERDSRKRQQELKNRRFDEICSDGARIVRDTLQIPGRQYERDEFRRELETLAGQDDPKQYLLDEKKKAKLQELLHAELRKKLNIISFSLASSKRLLEKARELCRASVAAAVIEELRQRPDINVWVEQGLNLHKKHRTGTCLFCNQPLPAGRLQELEAHFSEEYKRVIDEISKLAEEVRTAMESAKGVSIPDPDLLYPDLRERYTTEQAYFNDVHERYIQKLDSLLKVLDKKRNNPFQDLGSAVPPWEISDDAVAAINDVITEHNRKVDSHQEEVDKAKQRLKHHIIAERVEEYRNLKSELDNLKGVLDRLQQEATDLDVRRREFERELKEHWRPAKELNRELASYLGHSELQFEVEKTGYRIVRNGQIAESLSEGEKTAIAFLYFLKSLKDSAFDIQNGIVVIDDPISSLDSNALYYAFGFMKSRVKDAGQLFVLTHTFLFFRQAKDWFRYLGGRKDKDVGYYMLEVGRDGENRNSRLVKLDPLLKDYESEYHYLFSLIYQAAKTGTSSGGLKQYYYLPNVVRRLLEAFLEFKVPGKDSLHKRLEAFDFDSAKKDRIRRFCDTHSHSRVIDEPEQDPVILGEGPSVARDVVDLIRAVDEEHFNRMVQLMDEHG